MSDPKRRVRRKRDRSLAVRRAAVVAGLLVLVVSSIWLLQSSHSAPSYTAGAQLSGDSAMGDPHQNIAKLTAGSGLPGRVIYPYSVVPGGVRSPEDLQEASKHDQVVDDHYAGFDYHNAKVVELKEGQLVYLSYRLKNKIYWTKKKVPLRKGEKVITDGKMTARTRCANRVSPTAQAAVSPEEPPAAQFEEPIMSGGSATEAPYGGNFESALLSRPGFPGFGPEGPGGSGFYPPGGGVPGVFPPTIPPGGGNNPPPPPPPPPPPVPEPGTMVLLGSGIVGIYMRYRKAGSKK